MNPVVIRHSSGGSPGISARSTIVRLVFTVTGAWADRTTPGIQRIVPFASHTTGLPHRSSRDTFRSMRISFTFLSASRANGRIRSPSRNGRTDRGKATISLSKAAHRSPSARRRIRSGAIFPCSFQRNARREPGGTSSSYDPLAFHVYIPGPSIRNMGSGVPAFLRIFRPGSFPPGPCPDFPFPVCAGRRAPAAVFSFFPETLSQRVDSFLHGLPVSFLQQRNQDVTDPVPLEPGVEVRPVYPVRDLVFFEMREDILPPCVKKRPLDPVFRRPGDPFQPRNPRTLQNAHQDGFHLVVGCVPHNDRFRATLLF